MTELDVDLQAEHHRKTAGQRRINIIWEMTQAFVAVCVTVATLIVAATLAIKSQQNGETLNLLSNAFFLVIGFYFGRTNHQRTGGIGGDAAGAR